MPCDVAFGGSTYRVLLDDHGLICGQMPGRGVRGCYPPELLGRIQAAIDQIWDENAVDE